MLPPGVGKAERQSAAAPARRAAGHGLGNNDGTQRTGKRLESGAGTNSGGNGGSADTPTGNGTSSPAAPVPSMVGAFNGQFNGKMTDNTPAPAAARSRSPTAPITCRSSVDSQDADGGFTGTMSIQDVGDFPIQGYIGFPVASEVRIILTGGDTGSGGSRASCSRTTRC